MDGFTKWAEAFPLKNKEAETIAKVLASVCLCRSSPASVCLCLYYRTKEKKYYGRRLQAFWHYKVEDFAV